MVTEQTTKRPSKQAETLESTDEGDGGKLPSTARRVKVPIVSSFTIKYYNFYVFKENLLEQNVF